MSARTSLAALCGAILLSSAAAAQTPPQLTAPSVAPPSAVRGMEALDRRLSGFHQSLGITPAQEPQWQAFASLVRQNARSMATLLSQGLGRTGSMSALDQLRFLADTAHMRAEELQRLVPAFQALYDTMSAEQRTTADRVVRQLVRSSERRHGEL